MPLKDHIYWVDANMPPKVAEWLQYKFGATAQHVFHLDQLSGEDTDIFQKAKMAGNVIIITKDDDFVELVLRRKPPPKIIWITAGNLSNKALLELLSVYFEEAINKLEIPENYFVEIG